MITIEPATEKHALAMATRVRREDADELIAIGFDSALDGLLVSMRLSARAFTVLQDGVPASMMGIAVPELIGVKAMPWLITTDLVDQYPLQHCRDAKKVLSALLGEFHHIENWVDARYTRCIAWLKWLGFVVHEAQPLGPHGALFCRFEMVRA